MGPVASISASVNTLGPHVQLEAPQILSTGLVRRAAEKGGEILDRHEVSSACVPAVKPRTVMSSLMRRRNGLPAGLMVLSLSVIGLLPCVEVKVSQDPQTSTQGADPSRYRADLATCRHELSRERFSPMGVSRT